MQITNEWNYPGRFLTTFSFSEMIFQNLQNEKINSKDFEFYFASKGLHSQPKT